MILGIFRLNKSNIMNRLLLLLYLILISSSAYSQCTSYFPFAEGKTWTFESYNPKGKLQSSQSQTVRSFKSTELGFVAILDVTTFDKKGEEMTNGELEMTCENGNLIFDMRNFVPQEQMQAMGTFAVEVESENLVYPSELLPGKTLSDGSVTVTAVGTTIPMKINVKITDRKIMAVEKVTVPAGEFEGLKVTSNSTLNNQIGMNMKFESELVEWIVEGVGMVKSESYRKGKLQGYTILLEVR